MPELEDTELVTEPCRLAFPALFDPKPVSKTKPNDLKYQAAVLIPKKVSLKPFVQCIKAAMREAWNDDTIKLSGNKMPLQSCEAKPNLAGYEDGWHYINTKSGYQPSVVNQKLQDIIDPDGIFAGCWCRFHLKAYAWDHPEGGKGVSFSLQAVQLVREDSRLGGGASTSDAFEPIEVDDDDEMTDLDDLLG